MVMQINCYRRGVDGTSSNIATALELLDRPILKKLIIIHCPRLVFLLSFSSFISSPISICTTRR